MLKITRDVSAEDNYDDVQVEHEGTMSKTIITHRKNRGGPREQLFINYSGSEGVEVIHEKGYWGDGITLLIKGSGEIADFLEAVKLLMNEEGK
jgi:hypothetical protein